MKKPEVSVIMSVFNGERFLVEAVESILAQSFADFEFIVIDDGSSDGTAAILEHYEKRDSRLCVYHQENRGMVESLNRGCKLTTGTYIARMDADDVAVKDRLAWQLEFMKKHPETGVVGGAVEFINAMGESRGRCFLPTNNREIQSGLLQNCMFVHPTVLIRKDAFVSAGGYRRAMEPAEDYDLWLRIADDYQLANLAAVVLKYRHHPHQISVRARRQQALSCIVARAATVARRAGNLDPLDSVSEITPSVLDQLGVTEAMLQANSCRQSLGRIRSMYEAGEYTSAFGLTAEILHSTDIKEADKWVAADLQLFAAKLHMRQSRLWRSIIAASSAIMMRPMILGRPLGAAFRLMTKHIPFYRQMFSHRILRPPQDTEKVA